MTSVPEIRIRGGNESPPNPGGDYVLYWMTAFRRLGWNFALQHAADLARAYRKPLLILEVLKVDYPYASHRLHRFILDGMGERARMLDGCPVLHFPFVERERGDGDGLVASLGAKACHVISDDFPSFFLPGMLAAAGRELKVRLDVVDSNELLPLRAPDRVFTAAYHFRRFLQKNLPSHLPEAPDPAPLDGPLPASDAGIGQLLSNAIVGEWPRAHLAGSSEGSDLLRSLPLDSSVAPVPYAGTTEAASREGGTFVSRQLSRYAEDRNHPDLKASSGLSPYLHFGLVSANETFAKVVSAEGWTPLRLSDRTDGAREGWWGMGEGAEAFLDQLVTWRELGHNLSSRRDDHAPYESLPGWVRDTLETHEGDPRPHTYSLAESREARTHDPLWNAAQRQLLREGVIHNHFRMLWGKKILEWTPSAREALEIMVDLNDRFATDGRDPNSYRGILWSLGRYDRGWPERPVFGKVRSMSSDATGRKVILRKYLDLCSSSET